MPRILIAVLVFLASFTAYIAIAIILGVGLILYGLAAIAAAFVRRDKGSRFPVVSVVIAGLTVAVGLLLVVTARGGIDSLKSTFTLLGILLLVVGVALAGYAWMLRSRNQAEPAE